MKRRLRKTAFIAALALFAAVGTAHAADVTIGFQLVYGPWKANMDRLKQNGLGGKSIEFVKFTSGTEVINAMASGSVDISLIQYRDGATDYQIFFGSDSDGDPTVRLRTGGIGGSPTGPTFTLEGAGSSYHLYQLIFDPNAGSADLFIDGVERISNYTGVGSSVARVAWGSSGSITQGRVHYNMVQLALVPEPSSMMLVLCGITYLATTGRRNR